MANRLPGDRRTPIRMAPGASAPGEVGSRYKDETEYLLNNETNARRLLESVNEINTLIDALGNTRKERAE